MLPLQTPLASVKGGSNPFYTGAHNRLEITRAERINAIATALGITDGLIVIEKNRFWRPTPTTLKQEVALLDAILAVAD